MLVAVAVASLVVWQINRKGKSVEVEVSTVALADIEAPFTAEGTVRGETVEIEPEISGRIAAVMVREGDSVEVGAPLARISSPELDRAVDQAQAAISTADERVDQTRHAYDLTKRQVQAQIDEAQAGYRLAKSRLDAVVVGPRPEEIAQAEQRVAQATSAEAQAKTEYERAKRLYEEGALPLADYQRAATAYNLAQSETRIAGQVLGALRKGATEEERATARAQLSAAQAIVDSAMAARQRIDVSEHELRAASSVKSQAAIALASAESSRSKSTVTAPFGGTVSYVPVKVGDLAGPGRPLMTLVGAGALTIEAEVGDQDYAKVAIGQQVEVTSAALPGKRLVGVVERIASDAVQKPGTALRTRVMRTTVRVQEGMEALKPGMEVDVHGRGTVATQALTIPGSALVTSGEEQYVWVIETGMVKKRIVKVGAYTFELVQVLAGLSEGERVVVSPPETLTEGTTVKPKGS